MKIKRLFFAFVALLFSCHIYALDGVDVSIKIYSWNIQNFGKTKELQEINLIADVVKDADIFVLQEVVAGDGGANAVARLADGLNRLGSKWDYVVSDPTISSSYKTERYAFLWKTSRVRKIGNAWLEQKFKIEIDREPYYATFLFQGKEFTLVNFHAITRKMQPETEIKYFKFLPQLYPRLNLIFCGDFNLPSYHTVFNPLKKLGYNAGLVDQKTTLKQECEGGECLASEFDNLFYHKEKITLIRSGIIPFYKSFDTIKNARKISDHVPTYFVISVK